MASAFVQNLKKSMYRQQTNEYLKDGTSHIALAFDAKHRLVGQSNALSAELRYIRIMQGQAEQGSD